MRVKLSLLTFAISLVGMSVAHAATITWSGSGNDGKCSTAGNWAGGVIPHAGDDVVFSSTSNIVTWDGGCPSATKSISLNAGFSGRLLLGEGLTLTGALNIGTNQLFDMQHQNFTMNGTVTNSGTILLVGDQSFSGNGHTVRDNAGVIQFDGTGSALTTTVSTAFDNLILSGSGSVYSATRNITVYGNLVVRGPYAYQKKITIDHTKVSGTGSLTNFPIYFSTTDNNLKTVPEGGHVWSASGYDIIFTDANGTKLDHEIDSYNPTTGAYSAWVRIPTLSNTTDTTIYLVYGNPHILTSQENKTGVWDSHYIAVYHLNDSGSVVSDSTQYDDTGSIVNAVKQEQTGLFGNGYVTTGGQGIAMYNSMLNSITQLTMEAWVDPTSINGNGNFNRLFGCYGWAGGGTFCDYLYNTPLLFGGGIKNYDRSHSGGANNYYSSPLDVWHSYALTISQTQVANYVDATSATGALTGTGYLTNIRPLYISYPSYEAIQGTIDEVRVSNIVRSAGWIATEYNNESSPSTFYSVGSETASSILTTIPSWKLNGYTVTADASFANDGKITVGTGSIKNSLISLSASAPSTVGGSLSVTLNDPDQNLDGTKEDTVSVSVTDPDGDSEALTLTETSNDSGIFTGSIPVSHGTVKWNDGILENFGHQNFFATVSYADPHDSSDTATVTTGSIADTQGDPNSGGGGGGTAAQHTFSAQQSSTMQQPSSATSAQTSSTPSFLTVSTTGQSVTFKDIPSSSWFASSIQTLVEHGIASGYADSHGNPLGLFGPGDPVTYAQIAKMILLTAKKPVDTSAASPQDWAAPYISEAHALNLSAFTLSLDANSDAPRGAVIQTLLEALSIPLQPASSIYTDVPVSSPYSDAITTATKLGIVSGDTDANGNPLHTFRPSDPINRAEVAKILAYVLTHPVK